MVSGGPSQPLPAQAKSSGIDEASSAFAVRFARAFLADPSAQSLDNYLAAGESLPAGGAVSGPSVAQAEIARTLPLGGGKAVVTVACELLGGRVLYLAVPIVRNSAGEVAALGAPSLVAGPETAKVEAERPQPLSGAEAGAIGELVDKFLAAYVSVTKPADLSYYVAPNESVNPLGGLQLVGTPNVTQLHASDTTRTVIASVHVHDEANGVTYPLSYRLELVKRERWYVSAVEGAWR